MKTPDLAQLDDHAPEDLKRLHQIADLLPHLRRGDHQAAKPHRERERLALAKRRDRDRTHIAQAKPRGRGPANHETVPRPVDETPVGLPQSHPRLSKPKRD